ncbi:MAG: SIR2 family NAD-dependent protein deacylase [Ramlibacter sp.]
MNELVAQVRAWVASADRIAVLTGAGMSAESGVPTFRDAQTGLWARFDPQQLATEGAFRAHPSTVWQWYAYRRELIGKVEPNAGHSALADFARRHPGRLTLITQNVDGLHQRAGSTGVLALHGNIFEDKWLDTPKACCNQHAAAAGSPPYCDRCGNLLRPAVVWFGEPLPLAALDAAQAAAQSCNLMLVVGTSGVVYPAAGLARTASGRVVIVNPEPTELDEAADAVLRGTAAQLLPVLLAD